MVTLRASHSAVRVLPAFENLKTRLLAVFAFIIIPVAVVTMLLAAAADQSLSSGIDRQWRQSTGEYAVRTRLWVKGAARALSASAASSVSLRGDKDRCDAMLRDVLAVNDGYKALRVEFADGSYCAGAEDRELNFTGEVSNSLRSRLRTELEAGLALVAGAFRVRGQSLLAIQVDAPATAREKWTATALIDPSLLVRAFELNPHAGDIVALMERGQTIVAASGANASDTGWLPSAEGAISPGYRLATEPSRTGPSFNYASQSVLGPDLYILSRFDNSAHQAARARFIVLTLAPLIMLAALCFAYSQAIHSDILRWLDGIKAAMVARKGGSGASLAPESDEMPTELRDLAATFNEMARESAIREQSLKASLAENEFLLRELNHRVKTSLQIIQSYLSLTRRLDRGTADQRAVVAMEARVRVLSIAYRKALSEGRMRDVRIGRFASEIVDNLSQSFRHPYQVIELKSDVRAALVIDRAIPLGLALVESVMAGLDAEDARVVAVQIGELDDMRVELRVFTDGAMIDNKPNAKLMAGLASQLDARVESPDVGTVIRWRFQAGPPPALAPNQEG
jgi:two-component system, sensor histidine kinase PdtaS